MLADLTQGTIFRILEVAALAGAGWATVKQLRRDLNGLGRKVRDQRAIDEQRFLASSLIVMVNSDDKADRRWIAERILESNRGTHGT